jgi:hypothetical protein
MTPVRNRPRKPPKTVPANIGGHHGAGAACELLIDVGDDHGDDTGDEQPLHEAPENERGQALRGGSQQRWYGHREERGHDDFFPPDAFREHANDRRHDGDRQRDGAHGQTDLHFGRVKEVLKKRQQRLRAIDVQKRAGTRDHRGKDGKPERLFRPRRRSSGRIHKITS